MVHLEEYLCEQCGHAFPSHVAIDEETCPRCGSARLRRNPWLLGTEESDGLLPDDYEHLVETNV